MEDSVGLEASLRDRQLLALLDYHVEMEGTQIDFEEKSFIAWEPKVEELLELRSKAFGTGFSEQAHQEAKDATNDIPAFPRHSRKHQSNPAARSYPKIDWKS